MRPGDRSRLRGVTQVVQFNWPKVAAGMVVGGVGIARWRRLPWPVRLVVLAAATWTPLSLIASWWVYDRSPLRGWRFFADRLPRCPERILLVVAGFDDVSPVLRQAFPDATVEVVDVVADPEPSVRRARRLYPSTAPVVDPTDLGQPASGYDLVLFAQSAHEIRDPLRRHAMFAAARHQVGPTGTVVVVEHVRDLANAVAFGPGCWHFQTPATWRESFAVAGLRPVDHQRVTPLVHCWVLRR